MNNARAEIITEYHQLVRKLNISNRTKNENTELRFFIKTDKDNTLILFCSANQERILRICYSKNKKSWYLAESFEFLKLGDYIIRQLKPSSCDENINSTITNSLRVLFTLK